MKKRPAPKSKPDKKTTSPAQAAAPLPPEQLAALAAETLAAGNFKAAIDHYKQLLHGEKRPEWRLGLAAAYSGRARELAAKGMLKEAAVIWRNRKEVCGEPLGDPFYFDLLGRLGDLAGAALILNEEWPLLGEDAALVGRLRNWCAGRVLGGAEELLSPWSEDDALRTDLPAARAALERYCAGDDAGMEGALRGIPFRSPYRDLRSLLKGMALLPVDPAAARELLDRIGADSPLASLAAPARVAALGGGDFQRESRGLTPDGRRLLAALKGWDEGALKAVNELHTLGEHPKMEILINFLGRHKARLGEEFARRAAQRALTRDPKRLLSGWRHHFQQISGGDSARIRALHLESGMNLPAEIARAWEDVGRHLEAENPLQAALCHRRAAEDWRKTRDHHQVANALGKSLSFDPEDRESHLRLIRHYLEQNQAKERRGATERAMHRFPNDVAVLTEAVNGALADGAFKKAVGLAHQVLKLDPINTGVREALFDAHLAHARKQFWPDKHHLAERELAAAAEWARNDQARARLWLVEGMLRLDQRRPAEAKELLANGIAAAGPTPLGYFLLALECTRLKKMAPDQAVKKARIPPPPKDFEPAGITALATLVSSVAKDDQSAVEGALRWLKPGLTAAAKLELPKGEMERWCGILERYPNLTAILKVWADAALKRWPGTPVFELLRISRELTEKYYARDEDLDRVEEILTKAKQEGDERTAHRAMELLRKYEGLTPAGYDYDYGFDEDEDEDEDFDLGGIPDLPPGALDELLNIILKSAPLPPDLAKARRELGEAEFKRMMLAFLEETMPMGAPPPDFFDFPLPGSPSRGKKSKRRK